MDIAKQPSRRRHAPPNLITGVFLKSIFFLNPDSSKYIIVGVFQDRGNSVGVLVKARRGHLYYTSEKFNQFLVIANKVTEALETDRSHRFSSLDSDQDVVVKKVFGKKHALLYDGVRTLSLTSAEWAQFTNSLQCVQRQLTELFLCEDLLRSYVIDILNSEEYVTPPQGLPSHLCDRLFDEVQYFKRWPNGSAVV